MKDVVNPGCGFIQFQEPDPAQKAFQTLNGIELGGQKLFLELIMDVCTWMYVFLQPSPIHSYMLVSLFPCLLVRQRLL
jgi:hypothetical protein